MKHNSKKNIDDFLVNLGVKIHNAIKTSFIEVGGKKKRPTINDVMNMTSVGKSTLYKIFTGKPVNSDKLAAVLVAFNVDLFV